MPTLHATAGLPRSGKSTWVRQMSHAHGYPIVNPDAIRMGLHGQRFVPTAELMVWAIADTMVRALFLAGHEDVLVDACNTTSLGQRRWVDDSWDLKWYAFTLPAAECIEIAGADADIIPVIENMAAKLYWPNRKTVIERWWQTSPGSFGVSSAP